MQPDPNRYENDPDDDLEEQADEFADEGDAVEAWAEGEADAAPALVSGYKTLGGDLGRAMDNLERTLAAKGIDITRPPKAPERHYMERSRALEAERNKPILLEPWANDRRAAPNAVFRSALFPALNTKRGRRFVQKQKIYSVGGLDIVFTGQQFDQTDLDVYLEILNFAKAIPLGQPVRFSAYSLLKALGRCTGKTDHQWLHTVLVRLRGGTVEMVTEEARYFGGLIEGGIRDEITKHYDIIFNPSYAKFFGFGLWSSIDLDQRRQLAQKSTAKALHAYYSTHTDPAPHRYDTLAGIVGLENKNRRDLKAKLIQAHEELKRIGFLLDYEAGPDKIAVKATMTTGQQQHLVRKIAKVAKPRKTP